MREQMHWWCALLGHVGARKRRHMQGEVTCSRCERVIGWWR